jgi:uncharacterized phage protein (TIGR01671 family)
MMSDIKIKAWDRELNRWSDAYDMQFMPIRVSINNTAAVLIIEDSDRFEFVQCTGKKDKNGIDIYKGDILTDTTFKNFIANFKVVWVDDGWKAQSTEKGNEYITDIGCRHIISGSIYENHDILEKTDEN